jgi:hypothetical protein
LILIVLRNAPDLVAEDLKHEHTNTHYDISGNHAYSGGHDTFGSGTTGGAGFGNKNAPDPTVDYDNTDLRFDSHGETGAYKGEKTSGRHGSGSTAGAGFGNKTGNMEKDDSTMGKLMEKAGNMMHNEKMVAKGAEKRETERQLGEKHGENEAN